MVVGRAARLRAVKKDAICNSVSNLHQAQYVQLAKGALK
jgi:hypothetical protein